MVKNSNRLLKIAEERIPNWWQQWFGGGNASPTNGLTFSQWGGPAYSKGKSDARWDLVKPRFFRFEKINK